MQNFLECASIIGLMIIVAVVICVLATIIELCIKLHFRKCPYCGKRMHFDHLHEGDSISDSWYEFRCDNCGAYDKLKIEEIHK